MNDDLGKKICMSFNRTMLIFPLVTSIVAVDCRATEELLDKIPDISKILPPVEQYIAKMEPVTERYKDVFKEISKTEAEQRIENAKQKALSFYAEIFGVKLSEVEKYSEDFTTSQYLTWVAKETINNGEYKFANNEDELFDSCVEQAEYNGQYYPYYVFGSTEKTNLPAPEKIPEIYRIYVPYNEPYSKALMVHETGHVLDFAYRTFRNIRSRTMDENNHILCQDAVSVFFETLYTIKHDPTFILHRLTDLYGISYEHKYMEQVKRCGERDKAQNVEIYNKISELTGIENYRIENNFGKLRPEQFMNKTAQEHPELSFIYDCWKEQVTEWNLTALPASLVANADTIASNMNGILDVYKTGQRGTNYSNLSSYAQYIPHVYRTLKISDDLKSSENILNALDDIVKNEPDIMSENELKDFIKLLGL